MKKYICKLSSDSKVLSCNGQSLTFRNNEIYQESPFVESFPNLFFEVETKTVVKKQGNPSTAPKKITSKTAPTKIPETTHKETVITVTSDFSWHRFILLSIAIIIIAGISAYLRIHGIMAVFDIGLLMGSVLVLGFIVSEFAISALMLKEMKSKIHYLTNMIVLGLIQVALVVVSFVFEFSMMSNYIQKQKVDVDSYAYSTDIIQANIADYEKQIVSIQEQIKITPESYITKRSKLTSQLNKVIDKKNTERSKLSDINNDSAVKEAKKDGVGFYNTANILGVNEETITKSIIFIIASILNILYLSFMYGFIAEWKSRQK